MKFSELVTQAATLVQQRQRVTYRALKLEFALDDETFEALKEELLFAHPEVSEAEGRGLVWRAPDSLSTEALPPAVIHTGVPPVPAQGPAGEYRQLSVMFCDLVGSTALSAELDPEALEAVLRAYHAACHAVVTRYDGHLAQYLGDGVLIYFGFPLAHEDDAARAVHAGLEVLDTMREITSGAGRAVEVRIGIHTGPVMVTGIGSGERQETLALGEAPNLAARIQHLAAPGTLVIGASTARLVQGMFELKALGAQALAGVAAPVELSQVVAATAQRSAFEAALLRGLTPVVGRDHETGLLLDRLARVTEGFGQVVLISGEPGIGKSRLVQTAKGQGAARYLEYRCAAHFQHTALYPVISFLERALQFERGETSDAKLDKLAKLTAEFHLPLTEALPLLAALLSLPAPANTPPIAMSPAQQRQRTLSVLLDAILNEAALRPVCLVFEDLHWADATTLEFLGLVIEQAATAQVLVLATYRPEFRAPWSGRAHVSALTLGRLSPGQVVAMVSKIANDKPLPAEVVQQILLKTDGVPLFVEELTKMILESGLMRESPTGYELAGPLPTLAIPDTLQGSLQARLDRLRGAREVAQLGAVLGREFSHELIRAVSRLPDEALETGLRQLAEAELIYQRGRPPSTSYQFKHALVQDAAYQSLLKRRRRQLHRQVADALQTRFTETLVTQPELIAHHLTEAGQTDAAIPYWQQAGQRALERSANVEAVAHLNKGLALNSALPESEANLQRELSLLMTLAPALMATSGYAHPEVAKTFTRVRELTQFLIDSPDRFPILYGLWLYYGNVPDYPAFRELAEGLVAEAHRAPNTERLLMSTQAHGVSLGWLGEFVESRQQLEVAIGLYERDKHHALTFQYGGLDPCTFALAHAGMACWYLGYPERALAHCHAAVELAEQVAHPVSLAHVLTASSWIHHHSRGFEQAHAQAAACRRVALENQAEYWLASADVYLGAAAKDVTQLMRGLDGLKVTGSQLARTVHLGLLAEVYVHQGQLDSAREALEEAIKIATGGEEIVLAELHRLRGEVILAAGEAASDALVCFERAIEVARRQQAKSWELRAVMSLARVWQQQGKAATARVRLAEVYAWFTEGHAMPDLQDAQALLDSLGSSPSS